MEKRTSGERTYSRKVESGEEMTAQKYVARQIEVEVEVEVKGNGAEKSCRCGWLMAILIPVRVGLVGRRLELGCGNDDKRGFRQG